MLYVIGDMSRNFLPKWNNDPSILEPPITKIEERELLIREMDSTLRHFIRVAMKDLGILEEVSISEVNKKIKTTRKIFNKEFLLQINHNSAIKENNFRREIKTDDTYNEEFYSPKSNLNVRAELSGEYLRAILENRSDKNDELIKRFLEKSLSLSRSLRQHFWRLNLMSKFRRQHQSTEEELENLIVEDIKEVIFRNSKTQIIKSIRSSNFQRINLHILEIIDDIPLQKMDDDIAVQLLKILNLFDVYNKTYSPVFIYWAIPISLVFLQDEKINTEGNLILMVAYVNLVMENFFKIHNVLSQLAERACKNFEKSFPYVYQHIVNQISLESNDAKPEDFVPEVFEHDYDLDEYDRVLSHQDKEYFRRQHLEVLTDPTIFIRKWVAQAFVGVLNIPCVMWAWDQIILNNFDQQTILHITEAVLAQIQPTFKKATNYAGVRKIFLEIPQNVSLAALRESYQFILNNHDMSKINSYMMQSENISSKEIQHRPIVSVKPKSRPISKLPIIGSLSAKDLPLRLPLPEDDIQKNEGNKSRTELPIIPTARKMRELAVTPNTKTRRYSESDTELDRDIENYKTKTKSCEVPRSPPPRPSSVAKAWITQSTNRVSRFFSHTEAFDVYIDQVRFLPDNIRVSKVICQIINSDLAKSSFGKLTAFPIVNSFQRCPMFRYKTTINKSKVDVNPTMVLLFRLYGYQETTRQVVVVGSCLLEPFSFINKIPMLKDGGHQMRLRHGLPHPDGGIRNLDEKDLDENNTIPGCTLIIRLIPHRSVYGPTPLYEDGYYESESAVPTMSEKKLYTHYTTMARYRTLTIFEEIQRIQQNLHKNVSYNEKNIKSFLESILDHKSYQLKYKKPIPYIEYSHFVKYEESQGLNVTIRSLNNLSEPFVGYFLQTLTEVKLCKVLRLNLGDDISKLRFPTCRLDLNSLQNSPEWLDAPKKIYPPYAETAFLLIQVYGLRINNVKLTKQRTNKVQKSKNTPNIIPPSLDSDVGSYGIGYKCPLFWAAMPLFDKGYVNVGLHSLAIFKGNPPMTTLIRLEKETNFNKILQKSIENNECINPERASFLEVEILDGQLNANDLPEQDNRQQMEFLKISENYANNGAKSNTISYAKLLFDENPKQPNRSKVTIDGYKFIEEGNKIILNSLNKSLEEIGELPIEI